MRLPKKKKSALLLGLGLDNDDGHIRATRGENFRLLGGSHDTHQSMQEQCVKFNEKLKKRGKRLEQLHRDEFLDLASECQMNVLEPKREEPKTE